MRSPARRRRRFNRFENGRAGTRITVATAQADGGHLERITVATAEADGGHLERITVATAQADGGHLERITVATAETDGAPDLGERTFGS